MLHAPASTHSDLPSNRHWHARPLARHAAWLLLALVVCAAPMRAAAADLPVDAPLFQEEAPLQLTLTMDLREVLRDRSDDPEEHPAQLTYTDDAGAEVVLDLKVRTRGNFRLKQLNCHVPPLRLNFKKKQVAGTVFDGQDKIKLVTHCRTGDKRYEQNVLQEYLLYRAYRLIDSTGYRVRLAEVTYRDQEDRRAPITHYAFFIEHHDHMAARGGAQRIGDEQWIHPEATDREAITRLSLFQYMIGNTDWGVASRHNIEVVYRDTDGALLAVPYDFDWAGLIDAAYATPDPQLGLRSVRQRRYMGFCRSDAEFTLMLAAFQAQEDAVLALFRDFPFLEPKTAERAVAYLSDFYEFADEPRAARRLQRECQQLR